MGGSHTLPRNRLAELKTAWLWPAAAATVCVLQALLIVTHEPWLDEWQALQIAVQSATLHDLQANLAYEGHPPLWYWILRVLGDVFGPYAALPIAALIFGLGTQALILFASPFPRWVRAMLALSELIMFEYNTISRSFTLGVFLVFATLALWQRPRWVWLPIAVLPMADFLFGVFSGIFAFLRWREKSLWRPGVAAWVLVSGISAWSVIPAPDMVPAIVIENGPLVSGLAWLFRLGVTMVPFQWLEGPEWNRGLPLNAHVVLWLPFLLLCYEVTTGRPLHRLIVFGFVGLQLVFSMTIYPLQIRHAMLTGILLIALQWLRCAEGKRASNAFLAWLAICAACGVLVSAINLARPFDTADKAARRIESMGLADKHWLSYPDSRAQGVTALSGIRFARLGEECMQDFTRWDADLRVRGRLHLAALLLHKLGRHGRYYILSDSNLRLRPIAEPFALVREGYGGQDFYLYVVGREMDERPISLPPCSPGLRPLR